LLARPPASQTLQPKTILTVISNFRLFMFLTYFIFVLTNTGLEKGLLKILKYHHYTKMVIVIFDILVAHDV
jgi:hypothetical protein